MTSLRTAFESYVQLAIESTVSLRRPAVGQGTLTLIRNADGELRRIVGEIESGEEFKKLVAESRAALTDEFHSARSDQRWARALRSFFRRSGAYSRLIATQSEDISAMFTRFTSEFARREITVRYLAPMEFVEIAGDTLDCGRFEIRRLLRADLDEMLDTDVNGAFYPHATIDTARISGYSFLVVEEPEPAPAITSIVTVDMGEVGNVLSSYRPPARPIERALRVVCLFDWRRATPRHEEYVPDGWVRFGLPFVVRVDDALLSSPRGMPDPSILSMDTVFNSEGEELEVPLVLFELEAPVARELEEFCQRMAAIVSSYPAEHPWHFFEIAMSYLVRAFLTQGADQLLWHVTALEALIGGSPGEPVMDPVRKRLSALLGNTNAERKAIGRRFNELYRVRSNFVHGNELVSSLASRDLGDLRNFVRGAVVWFAHWLHTVALRNGQPADSDDLPNRADLLRVLDLDPRSRGRVRDVIGGLPSSFPNVPEWRS